jgi:urease accessory protein
MTLGTIADGFFQPLLVPAHVLLLLALGLLLGQQGRGLVTVLTFAASLAAGLAAIALAVGQTPAGNVVLAAAAIGGILVALAKPLPRLACVLLAAVAGIALGLDSPPQAISLADATAILVGTGLGACLTLTVVVMVVRTAHRDWQRIGVRIVGSWIAASATLVLALRYARGMLF